MQTDKIDFPIAITTIIEALNKDLRRKILILLENSGTLSYSELLQMTELTRGTINYHLKILISAGMIRNFILKETESGYYSFYEVSELGRNIINGIFSAFRPMDSRIEREPLSSATTGIALTAQSKTFETAMYQTVRAMNYYSRILSTDDSAISVTEPDFTFTIPYDYSNELKRVIIKNEEEK